MQIPGIDMRDRSDPRASGGSLIESRSSGRRRTLSEIRSARRYFTFCDRSVAGDHRTQPDTVVLLGGRVVSTRGDLRYSPPTVKAHRPQVCGVARARSAKCDKIHGCSLCFARVVGRRCWVAIRERLKLVDGDSVIVSSPGEGTRDEACVPLPFRDDTNQ